MSESEKPRPEDLQQRCEDEIDRNASDAENVMESAADRDSEGSGTEILKNELVPMDHDEEKRSAFLTGEEILAPEAVEEVEVAAAESSDAPENDSGLELPEDELLDLPRSTNARVISCTDREVSSAESADQTGELAQQEALEVETSAVSEPAVTEMTAEEQPVAEGPSDQEGTGATEVVTTEPEAESTILMVRVPGDERWFPLSEVIVQTTGEPFGESAARWISRLYRQSLESTPEGPEMSSGPSTAVGEVVFPSITTAPEPTDYRERLKKAAPKKSIVKELLGIVLGGIGGLLIAYYALNWFGGPRYDFAKIPLPGLHHTYKHAPPWLKDLLEGKYWTTSGEDSSADEQVEP